MLTKSFIHDFLGKVFWHAAWRSYANGLLEEWKSGPLMQSETFADKLETAMKEYNCISRVHNNQQSFW